MSTKLEVLQSPTSCLTKADDDEPVFVLRAKDPLAPLVIRIWAELAAQLEVHEISKIGLARVESMEMQRWRARKYGAPKLDWNS